MRSALLAIALLCAVADPALAEPKLELLSAGKGPRKPVRYGFQTGTSDRALMTMSMAMSNQIPGAGSMDVVIPVIETDLTVNLGEPKGDDHLFMFSIDDLRLVERAGVVPEVIPVMQALLDKMKGLTGSGWINGRGITRESSFLIPAGLPAEVRDLLEQTEDSVDQMSAPLPKEAIGVGARWQIRLAMDRGGIKLTQTMTYRVVAIRGDRIELAVAISQTAKPQLVTTASVSYDLLSYTGSGTGTVVIDLHHPVPESKVSMKVTQVTSVDVGGGSKQKVPTTVTVDMTIGRKN